MNSSVHAAVRKLNRSGLSRRLAGWLTLLIAASAIAPTYAHSLAGGSDHSCAITASGGVKCWGANYGAQLGDGSAVASSSVPVDVIDVASATALTASNEHTCAIVDGGRVKCWGYNRFNQLGFGPRDTSTAIIAHGFPVRSVAAANNYTCAVLRGNGTTLVDGSVVCWGDFPWEQYCVAACEIRGISAATAVAASDYYACALVAGGAVRCFGRGWNDNYQPALGDIPGLSGVAGMALGVNHMCFLMGDGSVKCRGRNGSGQLGQPVLGDDYRLEATTVPGISGAIAIGVGLNSSCALLATGSIACWGSVVFNDPALIFGSTPTLLAGIDDATEMFTGLAHGCARLADGEVRCWGVNGSGQLGNGASPVSTTATIVRGIADARDVHVVDGHACATKASGKVACWGNAVGVASNDPFVPAPVAGVESAVASGGGNLYGCALLADGSVSCWGNIPFVVPDITVPQAVPGLAGATVLGDHGDNQVCVITGNGSVRCWGLSGSGSYGVFEIAGVTGARAIATHDVQGCAVVAGNRVQCWPRGFVGGSYDYTVVTVDGVEGAVNVAVAAGHRCAIVAQGAVKCWGQNGSGQLGDGTQINREQPVVVSGLSGAVAIAAGETHSCAVLGNGQVWCWGKNDLGQLGNRSRIESLVPVRATGVVHARTISAGPYNTCVTLDDGRVSCWGFRGAGVLGDGSRNNSVTPQRVVGSPFTSAWSPLPPGLTGIWYEPASSGQGFNFEVLGMDRFLVLFNGFTEAGESLTLTGEYTHGSGSLFGRTLTVPVYQTQGRGFSHFDPASILRSWWGEVTLTLLDCSRATATLTGLDGSQQMNLVQLSRPSGLNCSP